MKISSEYWVGYVNSHTKLRRVAANKMADFLYKNKTASVEEIAAFAYALICKYGEASAALACEMYDSVAAAQANAAQYTPAEPAKFASMDEVAKAVQGAAKRSDTLIPSVVGRFVKQAGADTILQNAARDGAQFAWIPRGDTCAFCITLASRGWQYISKRAMKNGHAEHIHANCDCEYAIRFSEKDNVEGYDPEYYKDLYYNSDVGAKPKDKINFLRRELYKENKDRINAQKRAAYARRMENEESTKRRKALEQRTLVELGMASSNDYRKRIDMLTGDIKESRAISQCAKEILDHRSGTFFEDLAFYDTENNKIVINKSYDYYENGISACKPNKKMRAMINSAEEYSVIGIHNHPKSGAPSVADLINARERRYKYGIVLCHNGGIYKFRVSSDFSDEWKAEFYLAKLEQAVYNKNQEKIKDSLTNLKEIGIHMEVN